jgi:hypothetical protein
MVMQLKFLKNLHVNFIKNNMKYILRKIYLFFFIINLVIRGIYLFFFIISFFIRVGCKALWYRIFNRKKHYLLLRETDKL